MCPELFDYKVTNFDIKQAPTVHIYLQDGLCTVFEQRSNIITFLCQFQSDHPTILFLITKIFDRPTMSDSRIVIGIQLGQNFAHHSGGPVILHFKEGKSIVLIRQYCIGIISLTFLFTAPRIWPSTRSFYSSDIFTCTAYCRVSLSDPRTYSRNFPLAPLCLFIMVILLNVFINHVCVRNFEYKDESSQPTSGARPQGLFLFVPRRHPDDGVGELWI